MATVVTLQLIGCNVCQGFGHSKSNCITKQKMDQISKGGVVFGTAIKSATKSIELAVKNKNKIDGFWLYGSNIKSCAY